MSDQIVRTVEKPDGSERLQIIRREDGTYGFVVDQRDRVRDGVQLWSPIGFGGIYETAEIAKIEADTFPGWSGLV